MDLDNDSSPEDAFSTQLDNCRSLFLDDIVCARNELSDSFSYLWRILLDHRDVLLNQLDFIKDNYLRAIENYQILAEEISHSVADTAFPDADAAWKATITSLLERLGSSISTSMVDSLTAFSRSNIRISDAIAQRGMFVNGERIKHSNTLSTKRIAPSEDRTIYTSHHHAACLLRNIKPHLAPWLSRTYCTCTTGDCQSYRASNQDTGTVNLSKQHCNLQTHQSLHESTSLKHRTDETDLCNTVDHKRCILPLFTRTFMHTWTDGCNKRKSNGRTRCKIDSLSSCIPDRQDVESFDVITDSSVKTSSNEWFLADKAEPNDEDVMIYTEPCITVPATIEIHSTVSGVKVDSNDTLVRNNAQLSMELPSCTGDVDMSSTVVDAIPAPIELLPSHLTTPGPIDLKKWLATSPSSANTNGGRVSMPIKDSGSKLSHDGRLSSHTELVSMIKPNDEDGAIDPYIATPVVSEIHATVSEVKVNSNDTLVRNNVQLSAQLPSCARDVDMCNTVVNAVPAPIELLPSHLTTPSPIDLKKWLATSTSTENTDGGRLPLFNKDNGSKPNLNGRLSPHAELVSMVCCAKSSNSQSFCKSFAECRKSAHCGMFDCCASKLLDPSRPEWNRWLIREVILPPQFVAKVQSMSAEGALPMETKQDDEARSADPTEKRSLFDSDFHQWLAPRSTSDLPTNGSDPKQAYHNSDTTKLGSNANQVCYQHRSLDQPTLPIECSVGDAERCAHCFKTSALNPGECAYPIEVADSQPSYCDLTLEKIPKPSNKAEAQRASSTAACPDLLTHKQLMNQEMTSPFLQSNWDGKGLRV